jgi:hypothetical protein
VDTVRNGLSVLAGCTADAVATIPNDANNANVQVTNLLIVSSPQSHFFTEQLFSLRNPRAAKPLALSIH